MMEKEREEIKECLRNVSLTYKTHRVSFKTSESPVQDSQLLVMFTVLITLHD